MATKVLVPRLGEGVDELTIVKWLKIEGDEVNEMEPLVEVESDKVVTELPSPASGILLKIEIPENTPSAVGTVIAWIGHQGELVPEISSGMPELDLPGSLKDHEKELTPASGFPPLRIPKNIEYLSPVVRKIAVEHNVDLTLVSGTGLNGRITKKDVLEYLKQPALTKSDLIRATSRLETLMPVTTIRRQIAERMVASRDASPHVLTVMEVDMNRVVAHRSSNKLAFTAEGINLTYTAYFMAAIASSLKSYPLVNSYWADDGIHIYQEINIGMATSLGEDGLIVPVLRRVDELSLLGIARAVNDLANRARSKKLHPEEVRDGTFTLTNHGISGSLFAMPLINQPQCGILGVGAIHKRAMVITDVDGSDSISIRPMVYLSFVFDHRILDGASADWFLAKIKDTLEKWK